jgi:hypothetical protein
MLRQRGYKLEKDQISEESLSILSALGYKDKFFLRSLAGIKFKKWEKGPGGKKWIYVFQGHPQSDIPLARYIEDSKGNLTGDILNGKFVKEFGMPKPEKFTVKSVKKFKGVTPEKFSELIKKRGFKS